MVGVCLIFVEVLQLLEGFVVSFVDLFWGLEASGAWRYTYTLLLPGVSSLCFCWLHQPGHGCQQSEGHEDEGGLLLCCGLGFIAAIFDLDRVFYD